MFRRFLLLLLAWTGAAMLGVGFLALRMASTARDNARNFHQQLAEFSSRGIDEFAKELNSAFAFVPDLENLDSASPMAIKILEPAATRPPIVFLALVGADGKETLRFADPALFPDKTPGELWAEPTARARARQAPARGHVAELSGRPVLPIAYPLTGGRTLYAAAALKDLWSGLGGQKVGASGRVMLAADDGTVLPSQGAGVPERLDIPASGADGWFQTGGAGRAWVGAWRRNASMGWVVATLQPMEEAYLDARRFLSEAGLLFCLLALGAGLSARRLSSEIVAPLAALVDAAGRAAANTFDQPVAEKGWPELRRLARQFNHMMEQLKSYQGMQIEKILEEKSKVDALIQTIPEGILMADLQGRLLFANSSLFSLLNPNQTIPPKRTLTTVKELLRNPKAVELAETLMKQKERWVQGNIEVSLHGGHDVRHVKILGAMVSVGARNAGILLQFRDVTLETQLAKLKDDFFHAVLHDLRNPLMTVGAVLEMSQTGRTLTTREENYHRVAMSAYQELNGLIEDVLDMAKLEAGKFELSPEPTILTSVVQDALTLQTVKAELANIKLEMHPTGAFPPIQAEGRKLKRVVGNLLGNALKFTPKGGLIRVFLQQSDQEAQVAVWDSGPGIPPEKLKAVFERFSQLEGEQKRSGFGLGLTICQRFVELHRGKIWAESPPEGGARFIFRIPIADRGAES